MSRSMLDLKTAKNDLHKQGAGLTGKLIKENQIQFVLGFRCNRCFQTKQLQELPQKNCPLGNYTP